MIISKRAAFYVSFSAIILYWLYTFIFTAFKIPVLPDVLGELLLKIVITKVIFLIVIYTLLRLEGDGFEQLGFRKEGLSKQILIGIGFGFATWVFINIIFNPLMASFNPAALKPVNDMLKYMKDLNSVLLWIPVVILAAFAEEFQRIFILTRFNKWFGKYGLYIALVITSVAFGIGHMYQGINLAIGSGVGGLLNGLVYLRKRSAIEVIICHAVFDILSIIGGYMLNSK